MNMLFEISTADVVYMPRHEAVDLTQADMPTVEVKETPAGSNHIDEDYYERALVMDFIHTLLRNVYCTDVPGTA